MSFTFEVLPDAPILVMYLHNPFDFAKDPLAMQAQIGALQAATPGEIIMIFEALELKLNFGEMVIGMASSLLAKPPEGHDESRFAGIIVITENALVKMAAKSASQPQYGGRSIMVAASMDEAMGLARQRLAEIDAIDVRPPQD